MQDAHVLLRVVRSEMATAAETLLGAATAGLQELPRISEVSPAAVETLRQHLLTILEACAFQDLTGQRLDQLGALLRGKATVGISDPLLNGPAADGQGLDQDAADRLLSGL